MLAALASNARRLTKFRLLHYSQSLLKSRRVPAAEGGMLASGVVRLQTGLVPIAYVTVLLKHIPSVF
jgi:hypothetical protein